MWPSSGGLVGPAGGQVIAHGQLIRRLARVVAEPWRLGRDHDGSACCRPPCLWRLSSTRLVLFLTSKPSAPAALGAADTCSVGWTSPDLALGRSIARWPSQVAIGAAGPGLATRSAGNRWRRGERRDRARCGSAMVSRSQCLASWGVPQRVSISSAGTIGVPVLVWMSKVAGDTEGH
jgi:hypothetical protein